GHVTGVQTCALPISANGVPKRRNMWSQLSHHPPISKNIGLTGCGMWRSSYTQKKSFSTSDSQLTGNVLSPRNWPRISSVTVTGGSSRVSPPKRRTPGCVSSMIDHGTERRGGAAATNRDASLPDRLAVPRCRAVRQQDSAGQQNRLRRLL